MKPSVTDEQLGKTMAYLLRHHPEEASLYMDEAGWIDVEEMIGGINERYGYDVAFADVSRVVAMDGKQRYVMRNGLIRASQGHSIPVELGLEDAIPPDVLYHGTALRFVDSIMEDGILPMSRMYVHLSQSYDTAHVTGARHGKPAVLRVDAAAMAFDGFSFYLSENNVWLTAKVPPQYLSLA